ncbi:MAG: phosphatase PAP2 family protein [Synechococcus sp.]
MQSKRQSNWSFLIRVVGKYNFIFLITILTPLIVLCKQIYTKNYPEFDASFMLWLQQNTSPESGSFIKIFYLLGGTECAALVVLIGLGILAWKRYWQEATTLAFGSLGVLILVDEILKPLLGRRRPDDRLVEVSGSKSFPSGHATGNLFLYFYLSYLIAARFPKLTPYIYIVASIFLVMMGFSSVYVRAHWPTDIIAGYGIGYIWLTIALICLKISKRNKSISSEVPSKKNI